MYSVPQSYLDHINRADFVENDETIQGTITLASGTVINISEEDIERGSLFISGQMTDNSGLEVGSSSYYEMGMSLLESNGNTFNLEGASMKLQYGLLTSSGWVTLPLWKFIIDGTSINRQKKTVLFRANGLLMLFDDYIDDNDEILNLIDKTAYELLSFCCEACNIPLCYNNNTVTTQ